MSSPCGCIDIHTHVVPEHFPAYLGNAVAPRWPSTVPAHECHRHVMLSGRVYRTVSDRCWSPAKRLTDMDDMGVDRQVLSPMPELMSYWLEAEDGRRLSRYLNEEIARMVGAAPDRFYGLGTVPLQSVSMAIDELRHAVQSLGLAGVEIGSNVNGIPVGAPQLAPFFEAAESLGAAIFIHPLRPVGLDRLIGPAGLEQVVAFPGETGLAAASLLTGGTLARYPRLRIALSHGGGTLCALLPRMEHAWKTFAAIGEAMPSPTEGARTLFYDSLVYDEGALGRLIEVFGETQICVGSDFPFRIADSDPVRRVQALHADANTRELLMSKNAQRWLGIERGLTT